MMLLRSSDCQHIIPFDLSYIMMEGPFSPPLSKRLNVECSRQKPEVLYPNIHNLMTVSAGDVSNICFFFLD